LFGNGIIFTKGRGFGVVISTALQGAALGVVGECLIISANGTKHTEWMQVTLVCKKYTVM